MNENLGIYDELQARRVQYARFIAPHDRVAVKSHRITIDLAKPSERVVESGGPVLEPRPKPVKPTMEESRAALIARVANLHYQLAVKEREVAELTEQIAPRSGVTIARVQRAFVDLLAEDGYCVEGRPYGMADLINHRRAQPFSWPRFVCIDLVHRLCGASTPLIGKCFDRMDHTSVLHALKRAPLIVESVQVFAIVHAKVLAAFEARP